MINKDGIEIFESLNDVVNCYSLPHLNRENLAKFNVKHILIRDSGYLRFSLVIPKQNLFDMINKNFTKIVDEKIIGFKGVYGYLGVNSNLLTKIKESKELDNKMYVVITEYEGPFFMVNSGPLTGMVIINENIQDINFKTISS
jgi:hypothetical protein